MGNSLMVAQGATSSEDLAAEAIGANLLVTIGATGVALCGANGQPDGSVQEAVAIGVRPTVYARIPGHYALLTKASAATLAVGDYFKAAAVGEITSDGTSGSTVYAAATTLGKVCEVRGTKYWCRYI